MGTNNQKARERVFNRPTSCLYPCFEISTWKLREDVHPPRWKSESDAKEVDPMIREKEPNNEPKWLRLWDQLLTEANKQRNEKKEACLNDK